ncbi:hypothetical protein ACFQ8O_26515 [Streptomyces coelicoflavus]|uniref:hypothetical protein n=1 Tax=Streptomyces coelicoflavus TaxID=285562 RepID=UPI0036C52F9F
MPYGPMGYPMGPTPYNGPMPGPYPGPVVVPSHPGGGGGGGSTGVGSWTRAMLPAVGRAAFGPWGAVGGAVVAAATQIPAEIRSQRDKNAFYQSIEGGDNVSGFGERFSEEVYRWSTPMVFSEEEARKAFKGVTKLGYNSKAEGGTGRQEVLDFLYHGKTRRGQTVDEGLQQLQVNSKNALGSLNDLNDALNAVSDSAGEAGINAQMARAEFTQLMDKAVKSGYGSEAASAAALEQQTKNSYGRAFQDVDVSDRLAMSQAYMVASLSGISVSDYLTAGVTARGQAEGVRDKAARQSVMKPGMEEWIKDQVAKSGGAGNLSEPVVTQIVEEMLRRFYPNDAFALSAVVGRLTGQRNLDPVTAGMWLVQQYNDKGAAAESKELSAADKKRQKEASKKNAVVENIGDGLRVRGNTIAGREKGGLRHLDEGTPWYHFGFSKTSAVHAYEDWHEKTEDEDPVVYNLLNKIKDDDGTKVAVSTKDGKRVVSLADAIKRHRNELASGKAIILEEKGGKGQSVADLLGEENVDPLRDFSKEAKAKEKAGETYASWEKDHTVKDKKGREKLEISLTAEARRLLTVMDSTGVSGASATATPPLSPYAENPSYQE